MYLYIDILYTSILHELLYTIYNIKYRRTPEEALFNLSKFAFILLMTQFDIRSLLHYYLLLYVFICSVHAIVVSLFYLLKKKKQVRTIRWSTIRIYRIPDIYI